VKGSLFLFGTSGSSLTGLRKINTIYYFVKLLLPLFWCIQEVDRTYTVRFFLCKFEVSLESPLESVQ
jgi:hypothetical protein